MRCVGPWVFASAVAADLALAVAVDLALAVAVDLALAVAVDLALAVAVVSGCGGGGALWPGCG